AAMRVLRAGRSEPVAAHGRAREDEPQSAPRHPGYRADHVRPAQQAVGPGRLGRPFLSRRQGLSHGHSAQRAHFRSAVLWQAGPRLRSPLRGQQGLYETGRRDDPARAAHPSDGGLRTGAAEREARAARSVLTTSPNELKLFDYGSYKVVPLGGPEGTKWRPSAVPVNKGGGATGHTRPL